MSGALDEVITRQRWATGTSNAGGAECADDAPASAEAPPPPTDAPALPATPPSAAAAPPTAAEPDGAPPAKPRSPTKQRLAEHQAARLARWRRVHELHDQGGSLRQIAHELGINKTTVKRLLDCPEPPQNVIVHPRPGGIHSPKLAPYTAYLQRRWQEGCTNGCQLFRELVEQGYPGSCTLLLEAIRAWRPPKLPRPLRHRSSRRRADPRKRRWLLLRPPDQLDAEERAALELLLAQDPALATAHALVQRFRALLQARDLIGFHAWLAEARASGLPSFVGVANGMLADREAVEAAFTESWSSGAIEGTVHKIKLLKRQAYGRCGLDLLRRRLRAA